MNEIMKHKIPNYMLQLVESECMHKTIFINLLNYTAYLRVELLLPILMVKITVQMMVTMMVTMVVTMMVMMIL